MDFNTLLASLEAGDTEKATEIAKALKPKFEQTVKDLKDYEEKSSGAIETRDKAKAKLKEVAKALGLDKDDLSADKIKALVKSGKNDEEYKVEIANLTELLEKKETEYKSSLEEKDQRFSDQLVEVEIAKLGLTSDVVDDKRFLSIVTDHLKDGAVIEDGKVIYKNSDGTVRDDSGRPVSVAERMEAFKADTENANLFNSTINGGGGAQGNGATGGKKWGDMTSGELTELRKANPAEYDRLKTEHYQTK